MRVVASVRRVRTTTPSARSLTSLGDRLPPEEDWDRPGTSGSAPPTRPPRGVLRPAACLDGAPDLLQRRPIASARTTPKLDPAVRTVIGDTGTPWRVKWASKLSTSEAETRQRSSRIPVRHPNTALEKSPCRRWSSSSLETVRINKKHRLRPLNNNRRRMRTIADGRAVQMRLPPERPDNADGCSPWRSLREKTLHSARCRVRTIGSSRIPSRSISEAGTAPGKIFRRIGNDEVLANSQPLRRRTLGALTSSPASTAQC